MLNNLKRRDIHNGISTDRNPTSTIDNVHLRNSHSLTGHQPTLQPGHHTAGTNSAKACNESEQRISQWLKSHHVWFDDAVGNRLLSALKGIEDPSMELKLLKEWPDLIQIAEAANLNIIQRRKFINAAHDPMDNICIRDDRTTRKLQLSYLYRQETLDRETEDVYTNRLTHTMQHLPLGFFIPGPDEYHERYNISGVRDGGLGERDQLMMIKDREIKHILVMSDKEQEALARMDSIISQLHITRNLIRRRCQALDTGAMECENIIRKEFDLLRRLLSNREEQIVSELHSNKDERIEQLNAIDVEIESALNACHQSKYNVERIVETDTKYAGASWAVLNARRNRAVQQIENCIQDSVAMHKHKTEDKKSKTYSISNLIHTDMEIDNLLAFETFGTAQNIGVGTTSIQDWNSLNNRRDSRRLSADVASFKDLLFQNIGKLEDIEKETVTKHGFGENSYASHELNVFVRSPSQIRLRMCLPGFTFQRNQKRMHDLMTRYGAITDVEKSVDSQLNGLFKSVAKVPQHSVSAMDILIDKAFFVNEITKEFDDEMEIYKFDNHRSLHVELIVLPNPDASLKAAKLMNESYANALSEDEDDIDYYDEYGSPVHIVRIFEVELQVCRQPIPPKDAMKEYMEERKRRDSYDSTDAQSSMDYNLNVVDPTLMDWISLGWEKIKSQRFHKDRYDDEQDKIKKTIDIEFSEDWWKEQRVKLLSKVNLNEWPLRHEAGKPDEEIAKIIDDKKSVDNIICNDLLIRCRIRDFLRVSITHLPDDLDDREEAKEKLMSIKDEILVSQSSYSQLKFMKYNLKLPEEEPEDHYGIVALFSDRSLRFLDLYEHKLITLSHGVPGDHYNLPGLCAGKIPYLKHKDRSKDKEESMNSEDSDSNSDTLSVKPVAAIDDNEFDAEREYELKPTIIRCGGALSKQATSFVDLFDIEQMNWIRIKANMHCDRVYTQSVIVNGKLVVVGGEVFTNESMPIALTRRISALDEEDTILEAQPQKSCIEEYDFESKRWDISVILPDCVWNHSVCPIHMWSTIEERYTFNMRAYEIFICGGYSNTTHKYLSSAMLYDMMKDSLIPISPMKYLRSCCAAISFDFSINNNSDNSNAIYVIGGQLMGITAFNNDNNSKKNMFSKSKKNEMIQNMASVQFKSVEIYNLKKKKWTEGDSLNFDHGFYPSVWIQNLLDYTQKRSKEEKERLKRMSKMSKMKNKKGSIDPKPIYTLFVAGNGCNAKTNIEYLDPQTKKWKVLNSKQVGSINIGEVKSIKNEIFKSRKFTPYSIRDDILDRFDKRDKQNLNRYAIIDEFRRSIMCGIFALLSRNYAQKYKLSELYKNVALIHGRGPDSTKIIGVNNSLFYGFHRLAINDLSILGEQPMHLKDDEHDVHLICNGEIYNHIELERQFGFKLQGRSDCEVIMHLYNRFGDINHVVHLLDGVFAFTLYDAKKDILMAARDPIGVRPLFIGFDKANDSVFFASESKAFTQFAHDVNQFPPGNTWTSLEPSKFYKWWNIDNYVCHKSSPDMIVTEEDALHDIHENLQQATEKRLMSDRKIGTFLSGGLDSSLITALVNKYNPYTVNTYSVGMPGATDFGFAQKVANHLQTNHNEIYFSAEEGIDAVERVIYQLETYDVTTIRASIGMYIMSEYISKNTEDIVIYSGEGADEVTQGYLYYHNAPDSLQSSLDSKRLLDNLHYFDVKRVDRTVSCHGLEVRVPFLDKKFVQQYFKIDPNLRAPSYKGIEKYLVRKAFDKENLLPSDVLWRTKEAMSDGVSSLEEPWHSILGRHVDNIITDQEYEAACERYSQFGNKNVPIHKEAYYYRKLYERHFGDHDLIPYYWMPQWSDAKDPSARTIDKYKDLVEAY